MYVTDRGKTKGKEISVNFIQIESPFEGIHLLPTTHKWFILKVFKRRDKWLIIIRGSRFLNGSLLDVMAHL